MDRIGTNEEICIPEAPSIQGLVFRRMRQKADTPGIVEVINDNNAADRQDEVETVEIVDYIFSHLVNCDPEQDILVVEVDGEIVGYNRTWWRQADAGDILCYQYGCLKPGWRRKGIGKAMLRWGEERLRQVMEGCAPEVVKIYQIWCVEHAAGKHALLHSQGYRPARYFQYMEKLGLEDIPEAAPPNGIEIRPVWREHLRAFYTARSEAYLDHWGHTSESEEDFQRWANNPNFDHSLWRAAREGSKVVGTCGVEILADGDHADRCHGEIFSVSTRRPWRKRGIASALVASALQGLRERGIDRVILDVDTVSPTGAPGLYERFGFRTTEVNTVYRKPL